MYRHNPGLEEYVLVNSEEIAVKLFRRTEKDTWKILNCQAGNSVELKSIDFNLPIEAIYKDIVFESTSGAAN